MNADQGLYQSLHIIIKLWRKVHDQNVLNSHNNMRLKGILKYGQGRLNNLGMDNDVGENVGLLAGFICNKIPPWGILMIGFV